MGVEYPVARDTKCVGDVLSLFFTADSSVDLKREKVSGFATFCLGF